MNSALKTDIREFLYPDDLAAVKRIWREVGWVDAEEEKLLDQFFSVGHAMVATIDDEPECSVHTAQGTLRLQHKDLPLCVVTAVTTSRIARGHAFAKRLTALQLQHAAQQGAVVSALGMFDQGFYDQLGFGSGAYDNRFSFDPGDLKVDHRVATPRRLTVDDYAQIHAAMCQRAKVHGSVTILHKEMMQAELQWTEKGFGLGYETDGEVSHFLWMEGKGENGPYRVEQMAYQTTDQLLQLLSLLKSLSDQIYSVTMIEPPELQMQDLLDRPFRNRSVRSASPYAAKQTSFAWWQLRILDIPGSVAAYTSDLAPLRFTLQLSDPIETILEASSAWTGTAGSYIVELSKNSQALSGEDPSLPTLRCSVNAFTRMLFGVAPASSLAITDDLAGPVDLLSQLDKVIHLPSPHTGWDF